MAKALGTGFGAVKWTEVEVLRNAKGGPYVLLHGRALEIFEADGLAAEISISISHSKEYAVAQAIIEVGRNRYVCGNAIGGKSYGPKGYR